MSSSQDNQSPCKSCGGTGEGSYYMNGQLYCRVCPDCKGTGTQSTQPDSEVDRAILSRLCNCDNLWHMEVAGVTLYFDKDSYNNLKYLEDNGLIEGDKELQNGQ